MINFDDVTLEKIRKYDPNWPQNPHRPYIIIIIGSSGSGKRNLLFNLIYGEPGINKTYLKIHMK